MEGKKRGEGEETADVGKKSRNETNAKRPRTARRNEDEAVTRSWRRVAASQQEGVLGEKIVGGKEERNEKKRSKEKSGGGEVEFGGWRSLCICDNLRRCARSDDTWP